MRDLDPRACGESFTTRSRIATRSSAVSKSARDKATTSARASPANGSRSVPRGKTCSNPNGSRASRSTISRSRAMRRCWKASSSTSTRHPNSWIARRAAATRSGSCTCGTPGSFQASSRASSFGPHPPCGPVSAADDSSRLALGKELADNPFDQRCLARAAQGEVSDADHGDIDAVDGRAPQS